MSASDAIRRRLSEDPGAAWDIGRAHTIAVIRQVIEDAMGAASREQADAVVAILWDESDPHHREVSDVCVEAMTVEELATIFSTLGVHLHDVELAPNTIPGLLGQATEDDVTWLARNIGREPRAGDAYSPVGPEVSKIMARLAADRLLRPTPEGFYRLTSRGLSAVLELRPPIPPECRSEHEPREIG